MPEPMYRVIAEDLRLTESAFPSDRNQFVINAGEVPDRLGGAAEI